jgi:hypothetical protein
MNGKRPAQRLGCLGPVKTLKFIRPEITYLPAFHADEMVVRPQVGVKAKPLAAIANDRYKAVFFQEPQVAINCVQ